MTGRPQDIFQLPFRIYEWDEEGLVALDRNLKEMERMLSQLQIYEKTIGKPSNEVLDGVTDGDGNLLSSKLNEKMVGLANELQLADAAVDSAKLAVAAVLEANISDGAVVTDKLAANAVVAVNIAANAVIASKIKAGEITADKMNVSELSAITAYLGTIISGAIYSGRFQTNASGENDYIAMTPDNKYIIVVSGQPVLEMNTKWYGSAVNFLYAEPQWTTLSGTVSVSNGSNTITGSNTSFTTQLQVGDRVKIIGVTFDDWTNTSYVKSITNNTSMTVGLKVFSGAGSGKTIQRADPPTTASERFGVFYGTRDGGNSFISTIALSDGGIITYVMDTISGQLKEDPEELHYDIDGYSRFGVNHNGLFFNGYGTLSDQDVDFQYIGTGKTYLRNLTVNGTKSAIQETDNHGSILLYARESPTIKYIEEGEAILNNGVGRIQLEPMFLECIEPNTEDTKWLVQLTPLGPFSLYVDEIGSNYITIKSIDPTSSGKFHWSLSGMRKGYADKKFEPILNHEEKIEEDYRKLIGDNWEDGMYAEIS